MHLAQLNIGRLFHPPGDPRVAAFMDSLDRVNRLAERMPGFVWRLQDEAGNATGIDTGTLFGAEGIIVNMSVWETPEALAHFVWRTVHRRFQEDRGLWFEPHGAPHFVMWWIPRGHRPGLPEAADRLARLRRDGPTDEAFGWERVAGALEAAGA